MFPVPSSSLQKRSHPEAQRETTTPKTIPVFQLFSTHLPDPGLELPFSVTSQGHGAQTREKEQKNVTIHKTVYTHSFPPLLQQPRSPRATCPNPVPPLRSPNIPRRCIALPVPLALRAAPAFQELEPQMSGTSQKCGRCTLLSQGACKAGPTTEAD